MGIPTRVDLEPAYVLHARLYRESSQLLEVFTAQHGRVGIIARGARRPKSAFRGLLEPFQPLRMSWSGRGELATLTHAEVGGLLAPLAGQSTFFHLQSSQRPPSAAQLWAGLQQTTHSGHPRKRSEESPPRRCPLPGRPESH